MNYQLKMTGEKYAEMRSALDQGALTEEACFLLCNVSHGRDRASLIVKEVISLEPIDHDVKRIDRLSVSAECMLRIARQAKQENQSVVMVHTHPNSDGHVEFSTADDIGNQNTFDFFNRMLPNGMNGCMVFDKSIKAVSGRIYHSRNSWTPISKVIAFGQGTYDYLTTCLSYDIDATHYDERFSRQAKLLGEEGQTRMSRLHVVIVSAGGIGSLSAAAIAHSSNAEITIIDPKSVTESNLPRLIGAKYNSVGQSKVEIAAVYIRSINPKCNVNALSLDVTTAAALNHLKNADVVVCGTDTALSRVTLNELCHQHCIPVLEMGVQFSCAPQTGGIVSEIGRVNFMEPGSACFECCDLIDRQKLAYETSDPMQRECLVNEGYVQGASQPEASMIMFNMEVVARGIQRMVGYFTGLIPNDTECYESFSFTGSNSGKHHRAISKHKCPHCIICGEHELSLVGLGDPSESDPNGLASAS